MEIEVVLDENAIMPSRAHELDAGYDLYSPVDAVVYGNHGHGVRNSTVIDTGVHIAIPAGYVGDIKSKSGLMVNHEILTDGTIDAGYTGSIRVTLFNFGLEVYKIKAGQKIAQLVIKKIATPALKQVDKLQDTERGSGGFGSSGAF